MGESDSTISMVDADGVSLLALQALERWTREQTREIKALRAELTAHREELLELKR